MCRCEQWLGLWNAKSATSQRALALYLHIRELFFALFGFIYSYWSFILGLLYSKNKMQNKIFQTHFHHFVIIKIDRLAQRQIFLSSFKSSCPKALIGSGAKSLSTVLQNMSPFIYSNHPIPATGIVNMHVLITVPKTFQCEALSWKNGTLCFQTMQWLLFI